MFNDLMVQTVFNIDDWSPRAYSISEMTLAKFEDSGWYKVNYEYADNFLFGKNKGCDFTS